MLLKFKVILHKWIENYSEKVTRPRMTLGIFKKVKENLKSYQDRKKKIKNS